MTYKNLTNTEYMREYREKNKEKIKAKTNEYVKKYYKMNNEKVKTYSNARYRMGAEFVTFCRMFDKLSEKSDKCFCDTNLVDVVAVKIGEVVIIRLANNIINAKCVTKKKLNVKRKNWNLLIKIKFKKLNNN